MVLIHIEVQGHRDEDFSRRMHTYFYRILDRYGVAVTAIVLFTDDNPAFHPNRYEYDFAGTRYTYEFNTYKVLGQNEKALAESGNPFAIAVLTVLVALKKKQLRGEQLLQLKLALYRQLRSRNFSEALSRRLFIFLNLYVHFDKSELKDKFEKEIQLITNNSDSMEYKSTMNYQETVEFLMAERATKEQKHIFVTNLLQATDFDDEKIAALADVSLEFVQEVKTDLEK